MQCKKCQHKFSYKFLLRVIWLQLNYEDVECPQCHARYGRRGFSTFIMSILIVLPMVVN